MNFNKGLLWFSVDTRVSSVLPCCSFSVCSQCHPTSRCGIASFAHD